MTTMKQAMSCLVSVAFMTCAAAMAPVRGQASPGQAVSPSVSADTDLSRYKDADASILGMPNSHEFLVAPLDTGENHRSEIDLCDSKDGRLIHKIVGNAIFDAADTGLSPDGRLVVSSASMDLPIQNTHQIHVWDARTGRLIRTIDCGTANDIDGFAFASGSKPEIIVEVTPNRGQADKNQLWRVDPVTGRTIGKSTGWDPGDIDLLDPRITIFSRSKRRMTTMCPGEGAWSLCVHGSDGRSLAAYQFDSDPYLLISKTCFFSDDLLFCNGDIYNLKTGTKKSIYKKGDVRIKCLAVVPQRPDFAFFLTKRGMELWNIRTGKVVSTWPGVKNVDNIYFSGDKKAMAVHNRWRLKVFKFDPDALPRAISS